MSNYKKHQQENTFTSSLNDDHISSKRGCLLDNDVYINKTRVFIFQTEKCFCFQDRQELYIPLKNIESCEKRNRFSYCSCLGQTLVISTKIGTVHIPVLDGINVDMLVSPGSEEMK